MLLIHLSSKNIVSTRADVALMRDRDMTYVPDVVFTLCYDNGRVTLLTRCVYHNNHDYQLFEIVHTLLYV